MADSKRRKARLQRKAQKARDDELKRARREAREEVIRKEVDEFFGGPPLPLSVQPSVKGNRYYRE